MERSTISELQEEAVKTGNVDRFKDLELIRERLAGELGQPVRTEKEAARLDAQHTTSRGTGAAKLARLHNFEATYQYRRWEINDRRVSLVPFISISAARRRREISAAPTSVSIRREEYREEGGRALTEGGIDFGKGRGAARALEEDALMPRLTAALVRAHAKETLARTEQDARCPSRSSTSMRSTASTSPPRRCRRRTPRRRRPSREILADRGPKTNG